MRRHRPPGALEARVWDLGRLRSTGFSLLLEPLGTETQSPPCIATWEFPKTGRFKIDPNVL